MSRIVVCGRASKRTSCPAHGTGARAAGSGPHEQAFREGRRSALELGQQPCRGKVAERFERRVQRTIKGEKIVRNGTKDNPAYLVEQEDGGRVLKLESELEAK